MGRFIAVTALAAASLSLLSQGTQAAGTNGKIAFAALDVGTRASDIFTVNSDGSGLRNITNDPEVSDGEPQFSPDGTKIAFTSGRPGSGIFVMSPAGRNIRSVPIDLGGSNEHPTWVDNDTIAFTSFSDLHGLGFTFRAIYTVDLDGTDLHQQNHDRGHANFAAVSPDGRRIVFSLYREIPEEERVGIYANRDTYPPNLHTVPVNNSDRRPALNSAVPLTEGHHTDTNPEFVPGNSNLVAYRSDDFAMVYDLRSGNVRRLFDFPNGGVVFDTAHSPDGRLVAFSGYIRGELAEGRGDDIFLKDLGGGISRLTNTPTVLETEPNWQLAGQSPCGIICDLPERPIGTLPDFVGEVRSPELNLPLDGRDNGGRPPGAGEQGDGDPGGQDGGGDNPGDQPEDDRISIEVVNPVIAAGPSNRIARRQLRRLVTGAGIEGEALHRSGINRVKVSLVRKRGRRCFTVAPRQHRASCRRARSGRVSLTRDGRATQFKLGFGNRRRALKIRLHRGRYLLIVKVRAGDGTTKSERFRISLR